MQIAHRIAYFMLNPLMKWSSNGGLMATHLRQASLQRLMGRTCNVMHILQALLMFYGA